MTPALVVAALAAAALAVIALWRTGSRRRARHSREPIEYHTSWTGYRHPIVLDGKKISKQKADQLAEDGKAYLQCQFDPDGNPARITKFIGQKLFFDLEYTYHPSGRLKTRRTTDAHGAVAAAEYDRRGRRRLRLFLVNREGTQNTA